MCTPTSDHILQIAANLKHTVRFIINTTVHCCVLLTILHGYKHISNAVNAGSARQELEHASLLFLVLYKFFLVGISLVFLMVQSGSCYQLLWKLAI